MQSTIMEIFQELEWVSDNFQSPKKSANSSQGHTATLYQGNKLLIFGGENEHRTFLSDLMIFDLETAHWSQPVVDGLLPRGRARHASVIHDDKLFIVGGITGQNSYVLDDMAYLDLKTFTWSRSWRFVGRFDHTVFVHSDRLYVAGGLTEDAEKVGELHWMDLKGCPAFDSADAYNKYNRIQRNGTSRQLGTASPSTVGASGYAANSGSAQVPSPSIRLTSSAPAAPTAVSSVKFVSGPSVPSPMVGTHYHAYSSGTLLDFATPTPTTSLPSQCSLSALDLDTLRWQKLAEGREIFKAGFRWHYCVLNDEGTKAWLLGCPTGPSDNDGANFEENLGDVLEVDLKRYGLLGNEFAAASRMSPTRPSRGRSMTSQPSKGLGADLAQFFNKADCGTDFAITALKDDDEFSEDESMSLTISRESSPPAIRNWLADNAPTSEPIHVHKFILQARWPHFARLYNSQMAEFHSKKMYMPEPYSVVKSFLYYLYTDSISEEDVPVLDDVSGLLVLSNMYDMQSLKLLCVNRLSREMDVEHACVIWRCAGTAGEEWLRKRAANYCMIHWGRVVRTQGFAKLPRGSLVELSQEIDVEGRVVGGEELEVVGGLSGGVLGSGSIRRSSAVSSSTAHYESEEEEEDEGMEIS